MFRKKEKPQEIELKPKGVQYGSYSDSDNNKEVEIQDSSEKMNTLFSLPGRSLPPSEPQYNITSKIDRMLDQNERIIRLLEELVRKQDSENQNQSSSSTQSQSESSSPYYDKPFEERRLW